MNDIKILPIPGFPAYKITSQGDVISSIGTPIPTHVVDGNRVVRLRRPNDVMSTLIVVNLMIDIFLPDADTRELVYVDNNSNNLNLSNLRVRVPTKKVTPPRTRVTAPVDKNSWVVNIEGGAKLYNGLKAVSRALVCSYSKLTAISRHITLGIPEIHYLKRGAGSTGDLIKVELCKGYPGSGPIVWQDDSVTDPTDLAYEHYDRNVDVTYQGLTETMQVSVLANVMGIDINTLSRKLNVASPGTTLYDRYIQWTVDQSLVLPVMPEGYVVKYGDVKLWFKHMIEIPVYFEAHTRTTGSGMIRFIRGTLGLEVQKYPFPGQPTEIVWMDGSRTDTTQLEYAIHKTTVFATKGGATKRYSSVLTCHKATQVTIKQIMTALVTGVDTYSTDGYRFKYQ